MTGPRGSLTTRRMTAYWGVLGAAALTTLVAAAVAAALAVFAGEGLPLAARHDLTVAQGTSLTVTGPADLGQFTADGRQLRQSIGAVLPGVPLRFYTAAWSDPLGLVPGALPATPPSSGRGNTPILVAAAFAGIASRAVLISGAWPAGGPVARGQPIPAALPATTAALLHVSAGDVLEFRDRVTGAADEFRVTGVFAPRRASGPGDPFWALNKIPPSGYSILGGFATYGPLAVDPAAFGMTGTGTGAGTAANAAALAVYQGSWVAQPNLTKVRDGDLGATADRLSSLQQSMETSPTLGGMEVTTSLPGVLQGTASELAVARSLLVISAVQLLLLAAAALLATARLLASQRAGESALLAARGATRWQLIKMTTAEVVPLSVVAAILGALPGAWLAGLLAGSGPLHETGIRLPGLRDGATDADALIAAAAVALCAIGALLVPLLSAGAGARPGALSPHRGRQGTVATVTRAGADVALVLLAAAAGWQLRRYSAVSDIAGTGGSAGIDPVLALAPALALAGGTVVMLRLLPLAARVTDRLAARSRTLTPALAGWQFSRLPLRSGGAALLLVMAVATGTLALAQHESWSRSAADQAAFAAGADTRVDLAAPLPAGETGTIATASQRAVLAVSVQPQAVPEVLAIDSGQAASIALLRRDEAASPPALFGKITPSRVPGTALGGRPASVRLTATLTDPALLTSGRLPPEVAPNGPTMPTVMLTVLDAAGASYQLPAGPLTPDGRPHQVIASLGGSHARFPLKLIAINVAYPMPAAANSTATLTVSGVSLRGWTAAITSQDLTNVQGNSGTFGPSRQPDTARLAATGAAAALTFHSGFGRALGTGPGMQASPWPLDGVLALTAGGPGQPPIAAIATQGFLDGSSAHVGSTVPVTLSGIQVPVRIVAAVSAFPTTTGGALIVNLASVEQYLARQDAQPLPVTSWWFAAAPTATLPPGSAVTTAAGIRARLTAEPLAAAPQQALLALAAAAAVLAVTGFCVSIATGVRARRAENALLAALGVSPQSAAAQLCLEKLLLSVAAAVLGLVLGGIVARLLVPAVTLTGDAARPVPPPLIMLDLPQAIPLAAAVAVLPVLIAAIVTLRRPDPAAELRASQP